MKRYIVELSGEERDELVELVSKGKAAARKITHARVLLQADESKNAPGWTDIQISGLQAALVRKKQDRPSRKRIVDGEVEARLIALRCGQPPQGKGRWNLRLLADRLVALEIVPDISHETVRQALKKTN
jgi:hypothetical protein